MEHLDRYETEGLDTAFIDDATMEARMDARAAAEAALARRDRQEGRLTGHRRGLIAALAGDESDVDDGDRPRRRRRLEEAQAGDDIEVGRRRAERREGVVGLGAL